MKITSLKMGEDLKVKSLYLPFIEKEDPIEKLITSITCPDLVVITQTFCANRTFFSSAKEGTHYIIDMTERLFGEEKVRYVGLPCRLYTSREAREQYLKVAGRNWVATGYLAACYLKLFENGLVIDCGTNSTDTVPVLHSKPVTLDDNDQGYTRLKTGELFWSGLYFTHVPLISTTVTLHGEEFQVRSSARTMSFDIYVILGMISPEDVLEKFTNLQKDRNLISFEASVRRMLDLIAADRELLTTSDAKEIAQFLAERQIENTEKAIKKVLSTAKKKHGIDIKVAAIAGAGKDIILRKALENLDFEEVVDIEKAASKVLDIQDSQSNCETSLGCALMGLQSYSQSASS